jgi:oligopeptide transport system substrate-binding protein
MLRCSLPSGLRFLSLVLVALLFTPACTQREAAVESGNRTQTLHIGNRDEPPDLDPHTNNALIVSLIGNALYEGLVGLAPDGKAIRPGVAERWEISSDGRTYTFHLRANATWSNGDPVTADDFHAGFRRFLTPALGCEGVNLLFPLVGARDYVEGRSKDFATVGIRTPDPRTVELRLLFRAPYFLNVLADAHLVPVHQPSLDKFNGRSNRGGKWTQPGNLISNGPFTLKTWQPNIVLTVAKNPRYWDAARVQLNEIRFYPIVEATVEENAFRTGQLHITHVVPASKLSAYAQRQARELKTATILRTDFVTFNVARPPFTDPRVRRAFSLAIDRTRLAATVLKGRGDPAFGYARPGTGGYTLGEFHRHDSTEAKKLLREAGFPDGAGFPAFELTLGNRTEELLNLAQALQQMWQQTLGIKVQLAPTELKVWLDALRTKSFALTTDNWNMGIDDPSEILALGVTGDPNNSAGWSSPAYDRAFAGIAAAPTEEARRAAMIACEQLIADEAPYAPIYFSNRSQLVHPTVRGWQSNAVQRIDWTALSLAP